MRRVRSQPPRIFPRVGRQTVSPFSELGILVLKLAVHLKYCFQNMKRTHYMQKLLRGLALGSVLALFMSLSVNRAAAADSAKGDLAPLPLQLPQPTLKGTPDDLPTGPGIEPLSDKPRAPFLAPKGTKNVAFQKKVTLSDKNPISGKPELITDGQKEAFDDQVVEMHKNTQYAQVDLGEPCTIYAVVIWHDHRWLQVFHDVIVQVADDPDFTQNVRNLFNNDMDNTSGRGIGKDREYFETQEGKLIDAKGIQARYLRSYTKGSTLSAFNVHQEIEVYGMPGQ
jgi:hypothetical protein